jgi:type 1 fimbriae regulatory protein FimB/type 1 fimbriae regulatory protein FimE
LEEEIEKLMKAARGSRYPARDVAIIMTVSRHGLRASEACDLEWSQIEMGRNAAMHVRRMKGGTPSVHPIRGDEMRVLKAVQLEQTNSKHGASAFVFATERKGGPFAPEALNNLIKALGKKAKLDIPIHAHMLRHACGYRLAAQGQTTRAIQGYLGHRNIEHTVRYTELSPQPYKDFDR